MNQPILIVGDPIEGLSFASDSSLALVEGAQALGYEVHWATAHQIALSNGTAFIQGYELIKEVSKSSAPITHTVSCTPAQPAEHYQKIFIRKDPPFNESYTELCWFLQQTKPGIVVNSPKALLQHHEKMLPFTLARAGVIPEHCVLPSFVSENPDQLTAQAAALFEQASQLTPIVAPKTVSDAVPFKILLKPWRGHGGRGIQIFNNCDELNRWLRSNFATNNQSYASGQFILQPFLPEIFTRGDRRVFIVNGRTVFDFVRRPAPGRIEANLSQGGSATLESMTEEQSKIADAVAQWLQNEGILLAGLDFIGDFLTEVNITSPTGIRTYEQLSKQTVCRDIVSQLLLK